MHSPRVAMPIVGSRIVRNEFMFECLHGTHDASGDSAGAIRIRLILHQHSVIMNRNSLGWMIVVPFDMHSIANVSLDSRARELTVDQHKITIVKAVRAHGWHAEMRLDCKLIILILGRCHRYGRGSQEEQPSWREHFGGYEEKQ